MSENGKTLHLILSIEYDPERGSASYGIKMEQGFPLDQGISTLELAKFRMLAALAMQQDMQAGAQARPQVYTNMPPVDGRRPAG